MKQDQLRRCPAIGDQSGLNAENNEALEHSRSVAICCLPKGLGQHKDESGGDEIVCSYTRSEHGLLTDVEFSKSASGQSEYAYCKLVGNFPPLSKLAVVHTVHDCDVDRQWKMCQRRHHDQHDDIPRAGQPHDSPRIKPMDLDADESKYWCLGGAGRISLLCHMREISESADIAPSAVKSSENSENQFQTEDESD